MKKIIILILIYLIPKITLAEVDVDSYKLIHKKTFLLNLASILYGPGGNFQNAGKLINTDEISHNSLEYYQIYALYINSIYGKDKALSYIDSLEYIGNINNIENIYSKGIISYITGNYMDLNNYELLLNNIDKSGVFCIKLNSFSHSYNIDSIDKRKLVIQIDSTILKNKISAEDLFYFNLLKFGLTLPDSDDDIIQNNENGLKLISLCSNNLANIEEILLNKILRYFTYINLYDTKIIENKDTKITNESNRLIQKMNISLKNKNIKSNRYELFKIIETLSLTDSYVKVDSFENYFFKLIEQQTSPYEKQIFKLMVYTSIYKGNSVVINKFANNITLDYSKKFIDYITPNCSIDSLYKILYYEFSDINIYSNEKYMEDFIKIQDLIERNNTQISPSELAHYIGYSSLIYISTKQEYELNILSEYDYTKFGQRDLPDYIEEDLDRIIKFLELNPHLLLEESMLYNIESDDINNLKKLVEFYSNFHNLYPANIAILKNKIYLLDEYYRRKNGDLTTVEDSGETLEILKTIIQLLTLNQSEGAYTNEYTKLTYTLCAKNLLYYRYNKEDRTFYDFFNRLNDNQKNEFISDINLAISKYPQNVNLRRLKLLFIEMKHFRLKQAYTIDDFSFYFESLNYFTHTSQKFSSFISLDNTLMLKLIEEKRIEKYTSIYDWNIIPYLFYFNQLDKASAIIKTHFDNNPESIVSNSIDMFNQITENTQDNNALDILNKLHTDFPENIFFSIYYSGYLFVTGNIKEAITLLNEIISNDTRTNYLYNDMFNYEEVYDQIDKLFERYDEFFKEKDKEEYFEKFQKLYKNIEYEK